MKRKYAGLLFLLLLSITTIAQKQNNNWAFGNHLGLNFNVAGPVLVHDSLFAIEGCAAVSDYLGNLLFYSDGANVFDRTHHIMPNGGGILGGLSTSQGVAIEQIKDRDSLYYLFTITDASTPGYLRYTIINMNRNSGLGDVDTPAKNILLAKGMGEQMTIAADCSRHWLLVHNIDTPVFYAYDLSSGRIGTPVISKYSSFSSPLFYAFGEMKYSRQNKKIALVEDPAAFFGAAPEIHRMELHDFNPVTGAVSGYQLLDSFIGPAYALYGTDFSPDGTKLYITGKDSLGLLQYDLSAGSLTAIKATKYQVAKDVSYGLRMGPDKMLYAFPELLPHNFSRVRKPNLAGPACSFERDILPTPFRSTVIMAGFGNYFVPPGDTTYFTWDTVICSGSAYTIVNYGYDKYLWNDGDTSPVKTLKYAGDYWLQSSTECNLHIDTFHVHVIPLTHIGSFTEISACEGLPVTLHPDTSRAFYLWADGDTGRVRTIRDTGLYLLTSYSGCDSYTDSFFLKTRAFTYLSDSTFIYTCFKSSQQLKAPAGYTAYLWSAGNTGTDTSLYRNADITVTAMDTAGCRILTQDFHVTFISFSSHIPDTFTCNNDPIQLDATIAEEASYRWSTGDTTAVIKVQKADNYLVNITVAGCTLTDTIQVGYKPLYLSIGNDTSVCKDRSLQLRASVTDAQQYLWSTGTTGQDITINQTGHYSLQIIKDGCSTTATADISFVNCEHCIAFPNAFTPNDDGINDFFKPLLNCPTETYELGIYNRWGQQVWHTSSPADTWDGTVKGIPADGNTYFYMLRISFTGQNKATELYKGEVSLIR